MSINIYIYINVYKHMYIYIIYKYIHIYIYITLFLEMCAIPCAHAGTHTGKFTCAIYHMCETRNLYTGNYMQEILL